MIDNLWIFLLYLLPFPAVNFISVQSALLSVYGGIWGTATACSSTSELLYHSPMFLRSTLCQKSDSYLQILQKHFRNVGKICDFVCIVLDFLTVAVLQYPGTIPGFGWGWCAPLGKGAGFTRRCCHDLGVLRQNLPVGQNFWKPARGLISLNLCLEGYSSWS